MRKYLGAFGQAVLIMAIVFPSVFSLMYSARWLYENNTEAEYFGYSLYLGNVERYADVIGEDLIEQIAADGKLTIAESKKVQNKVNEYLRDRGRQEFQSN